MPSEYLGQWIPLVKDTLTIITSIVIAVAAVYGVSQWRRELKGRSRFDLVKKLSYEAFRFRDLYKRSRGFVTLGTESIERERFDDETKLESRYRDEYYARMKRIEPLQESLRNMYQASWEAEIVLDTGAEQFVEPFERKFKDLYIAIDTYFSRHVERARAGAGISDEDRHWLDDYHKIIYGHADDELSKEIDKITREFNDQLKGYID